MSLCKLKVLSSGLMIKWSFFNREIKFFLKIYTIKLVVGRYIN